MTDYEMLMVVLTIIGIVVILINSQKKITIPNF